MPLFYHSLQFQAIPSSQTGLLAMGVSTPPCDAPYGRLTLHALNQSLILIGTILLRQAMWSHFNNDVEPRENGGLHVKSWIADRCPVLSVQASNRSEFSQAYTFHA